MTTTILNEKPLVSKKEVGVLLFLAAEAMFFAGLISAYLVLRAQIPNWPPSGQPRFPVLVTGLNTLILILSGVTLFWSYRCSFKEKKSGLKFFAILSLVLGLAFLLIQGYEWTKLIQFGLATHQSVYAGTFYVLIGTHAAHVLGGLIFLASVVFDDNTLNLKLGLMYWFFVVALWPILYALVYF